VKSALLAALTILIAGFVISMLVLSVVFHHAPNGPG
jgi:hypothetical protein